MCVRAPVTHKFQKGVLSYALLPICVCCLQEEDEVPDDETVNQMIARSEEEFDQFMVNTCILKKDYSSVQLNQNPLQTSLFLA